MIKSIKVTSIIQTTITDPYFVAAHRRNPKAFTRNRKLPFAIVMGKILQLAKRSLQIECNLLGDRLMTEPVSKQAFSKARYNISYTGFKALNTVLLKEAYQDDRDALWHGYRVFGVDGSTLRLPKSDEIVEYFGVCAKTNDDSSKCPVIARVSEIVELTTGIVVSAEISPWCFGERSLAYDQLQEVAKFFRSFGQEKQIFVFDRGYISKKMIQLFIKLKIDFMFRVPQCFNTIIDAFISQGETDVLVKPFPDLEEMRLVVRDLPSGEQCVLLTSIGTSSAISGDDLFGLYWLRWSGSEEGYKKQKISLELENFTGTGIEAVLQEFWATIVMVNLFQIHCWEEEGGWDVKNPPETRINRNVVFGSLRSDIFDVIIGSISPEDFYNKFIKVARRSKIKVRPGRQYSREKVGKPKRHHVFRRVC